jgi:apolipoprotein D and lipocalin family protein
MIKNFILMFFISIILSGCKIQYEPLQTVFEVNLERYCGSWYEIAAFPQKFQKGCKCTTAEYKQTDKNYIRVINKCLKPDKFASIEGKAFVVKGSGNAKLKVQFFWPFKGDYWIIELDKDYKWAAVGNKSRKYLWILCRQSKMEDKLYNDILNKLSAKGFDISKLKKTDQECK